MSKLAVRVAEDSSRPMGHAVITVDGVAQTLTTFEFLLRRHGFADNNLGPGGWQGPECWLQPEEAWYNGDSFKFVVGPDVVYQMESMPYELVLRGKGMEGIINITFVWPLELDVEQADAGECRVLASGTKVHPAPQNRTQELPKAQSTSVKTEVPLLDTVEVDIPARKRSAYTPPPAPPPKVPQPKLPEPPRVEPGIVPPPPEFANPMDLDATTEIANPVDAGTTKEIAGPEDTDATKEMPAQPPPMRETSAEAELPTVDLRQLRPTAPAPAAPETVSPRRGRLPVLGLAAVGGVAVVVVASWLLWQKGGGRMLGFDPVLSPQAPVSQPVSTEAPASAPTVTAAPTPPPAVTPVPAPAPDTGSAQAVAPPATVTPAPTPAAVPEPVTRSEPSPPPTGPVAAPARSRPAPESAATRKPAHTHRPVPAPKSTAIRKQPRPASTRDLEAELKAQFESNVESELESTLKHNPPPKSGPPARNPP